MGTFEPGYNKSERVSNGRRAQIEISHRLVVDVLDAHVNIACREPREESGGWFWLSLYQSDRKDAQTLDDLIDALTFARDKLKE